MYIYGLLVFDCVIFYIMVIFIYSFEGGLIVGIVIGVIIVIVIIMVVIVIVKKKYLVRVYRIYGGIVVIIVYVLLFF